MFLNHEITEEKLFTYLKKQDPPVLETKLLREFFPEQKENRNSLNKTLIKQHFILYHYLHKLAQKLLNSDYVLTIHSIYIYLFQKPEKNLCPHLNPDNLEFCLTPKKTHDKFCSKHLLEEEKILIGQYLNHPGIEQYYLDEANYLLLDDEYEDIIIRAEKIKDMAFHSVDIKQHYQNLKLSENCTIGDVKKQYRQLVKKFHPDILANEENCQQFYTIKESYEILLNLMGNK